MASVILSHADVPIEEVPGMQGSAPIAFWTSVAEACHNGINANGLDGLVSAALQFFPYNPFFLGLRDGSEHASGHAPVAGPLYLAFVAANSSSSERLALDEEWRAIADRIARSRNARNIVSKVVLAATPQTLLDELLDMRPPPTIVHFAGHGTKRGHLILQGANGSDRGASRTAVADLLAAIRDQGARVQLLVLNACYSASFAEALTPEVEAIIGWFPGIAHGAAVAFSSGLYAAIANGRSVTAAVQAGRAAMSMEGFPNAVDSIGLTCRQGQTADKLVLLP